MNPPIVTIDFRKHPLYSSVDFYKDKGYCDIFKAEILMIAPQRETIRVRLLDIDTNEVLFKNVDTSIDYIVEDSVLVVFKEEANNGEFEQRPEELKAGRSVK